MKSEGSKRLSFCRLAAEKKRLRERTFTAELEGANVLIPIAI